LLLIFIGLGAMYRGKAVAVAFVAVLIPAIPTWIAVTGGSAAGQDLQPRYIYPLMIVLAGVSLVQRFRTSSFSLSAWQRWLIVLVLAGTQSLALHVNMRRYISGNDVSAINLDHGREWWWDTAADPNAVWIAGTIAFAILAFAAMETFRRERSDDCLSLPLGRG
jgi:hypothetical protein